MKKYYGMYRAKVEDINDVDIKSGRVRVRVMGLHSQSDSKSATDGIPIEELPWAEQANSLFGGFSPDNDNKSGISTVPSIGSWVWVFFEEGDWEKPVYFATITGKDDRDPVADETEEAQDETTIITTKLGHKLTVKDTVDEGKIEIESSYGHKVTIDDTKDAELVKLEDGDGNFIEMKKENSASGSDPGITINGEKQLCTKALIEDIIKPVITDLMSHSHPPYSMPSPALTGSFPQYIADIVTGMIAGTDTILTEKTRAN